MCVSACVCVCVCVRPGFKIVILSNQKGVGSGKTPLAEAKGRFEQIARAAGVPVQMFFATDETFYRKPCIGMWHLLVTRCNGGVGVDVGGSCYVGDAAGRPGEGARKRDFSAGDIKFALNIGTRFFTPEQYFLGSTEVRVRG